MLKSESTKKYDKYKASGIEWIREIPQDWKYAKLAWCANFINGFAFDSEKMNIDGEIPVVRIGDIQNNKVNYETCLKVAKDKNLEPYEIRNNDIVIAMSGATTGKLALICDEKKAYINQRVGIIRSKNNRFIRYCLDNESFLRYVSLLSAGSAQPNISMGNILDYKLPYISFIEQQAIADYLDKKCGEIDRVVETEKAVIERLKEYKQSVITEAVTKGLDKSVPLKDSGIEWIGKIPQHWKDIKLKFCTYIRARLGWKGLKAEEYVEDGYPLLSAFNIVNSKLIFEDLNFINQFRYDESPEIKLQEQDLLLVKDGAGIGKCAIVENMLIPSTVNGSIAVITTNYILMGKFLYYYFLSDLFQAYIDRLKDGMGVPHLFQADLKEINIVIPNTQEQQQIADYLDNKCSEIDKAITGKEQLIEKLAEYKKSLIYECVTGKRKVGK